MSSRSINRIWLRFLDGELRYGLQTAVEAKVLADVNGTSGIQTQAYATSVLTTLRMGITKLKQAGYTPSAFVLRPADWEGVELRTWRTDTCVDIGRERATRRRRARRRAAS